MLSGQGSQASLLMTHPRPLGALSLLPRVQTALPFAQKHWPPRWPHTSGMGQQGLTAGPARGGVKRGAAGGQSEACGLPFRDGQVSKRGKEGQLGSGTQEPLGWRDTRAAQGQLVSKQGPGLPIHTRSEPGPPESTPPPRERVTRVWQMTVRTQSAFPCPSDTWGGRSPQRHPLKGPPSPLPQKVHCITHWLIGKRRIELFIWNGGEIQMLRRMIWICGYH